MTTTQTTHPWGQVGAMPQSVEAEEAVLGSILIDTDAFFVVSQFLTHEDFYRDAHRSLFEAMASIAERDEPVDYITICDELERNGKLEAIGGDSFITSLINRSPSSANADYYGHIVERYARCRRLIEAGSKMIQSAYEGDDAQAQAQAEQTAWGDRRTVTQSLEPVSNLLAPFLEELDALAQKQQIVTGVPTGFNDLDTMMGGLNRSDLIIVAGRPAMGKTSLALTMAYNASVTYARGVAFFSLEMSKQQLLRRLVSMDAGIDQQRLKTGHILDEEWERINHTLRRLTSAPLYIDDTAGVSCAHIRSKIRALMTETPIDLIVVDYLQMMQSTGGKRNDNRVQEVSEMSRGLKLLGREFDVPVLALAQLSRAVESRQNKIPQLSDLRESGSIENDADIVMFIYRDDVYNPDSERPNQADIIVAKHRNGPVGEIGLYFQKSSTRFLPLEETLHE